MLQNYYNMASLPVGAGAGVCAPVCACASSPYIYTRGASWKLEAASWKLQIEGGNPMNKLLNNIRISDLPSYIKTSSFVKRTPELDCYWSSDVRCSFPFVLAITGNIATSETFPYNRKEYRRTGRYYRFLRRANYRGGWHQLSFTFEILEKVATGEQVAILHEVVRGGPVF